MSNQVLNHLLSRRSVVANELIEPGPDNNELDLILKAAHRVPDHKKLGPFRFIIFSGEARDHAGEKLAEIFCRKDDCEVSEKLRSFEQNRFARVPLVIGVVFSPVENEKAPEIEQLLTTGAVCQNMLNAATALGYGAQWLTEWYSYDEEFLDYLELQPQEKMAGFIYVGTAKTLPKERARPELDERIKTWK